MKKSNGLSLSVLFCLTFASVAQAGGNGTSGGLTLLEAPGARASALGQTLTASVDDVSAFAYNPSMLKSLKTGQASFLYQKGMLDDAYSQLVIGSPWNQMGVGLSIGYYNGGNFNLNDGVSQTRSVNAERDLVVSLGMARSMGPVSVGLTGKYLSSQLVESAHATAYAADLGLSYAASSRFMLGGAIQNFGTQLKFDSQGDNLPRIMRVGASYSMFPQYGTILMIDVERMMNEGETRPGLGLETRVGPMALRAGYRHSASAKEFSVGTGFAWGRQSLDYAFGMINQDLQTQQRISYSFRFGGAGNGDGLFARSNPSPNVQIAKASPESGQLAMATADRGRHFTESAVMPPSFHAPLAPAPVHNPAPQRVYTIKTGDTLAKIALDVYGDHRMWRTIYMANRHLMNSPTELEVGQKIALP